MKILGFFLSLLIFLSGCINAPVVQSPGQLAATHGYVYVSFPKESSISPVKLESLKDGSTFLLQMRHGVDSNGAGLWVPAGEYKLAEWGSYELQGYPTISVREGRITDLGGLVQLPIGGYKFVVLPVRSEEFSADLKIIEGEYKSVLHPGKNIEWNVREMPASIETKNQSLYWSLILDLLLEYERYVRKPAIREQLADAKTVSEFLKLWKSAAPPLTEKNEHDVSANMYFGADVGQVRVRSPRGEWSALDTGSFHEVTAVKVTEQALVTGYDNGAIRISKDGGISWRTVAALGSDSRIMDIDRRGNHWLVAVARGVVNGPIWKEFSRVEVYHSDLDDLQGLVKIKQIDRGKELKSLDKFEVWADSANDFYYVGTSSQLLRMSLSTMTWNSISPPSVLTGFHASSTSGELTAFLARGVFSKLYLSNDNGETWAANTTPPYAFSDIRFDNLDEGWAVRWNSGLIVAAMELRRFDREKNAWEAVTEAPAGCRHMLPDVAGHPRFCITEGGSIIGYTNSKWMVEYSVN
ncbi:sialidase family protein [Burkholderia sp. Ac-20379]|uniref:sialidase family protein n=1 Tax=Burkholderia sp. Ac-20379 TaxID=2703900 RepID=UPI0019816689|nr:hypothetical protein [Burkholderia sp. Ac-20379]MBN3728290.1 hypothetical protein [Burkholderia sp. Ac-20379]